MDQEEAIKSSLQLYNDEIFPITQFFKGIVSFFSDNPKLNTGPLPIIHSIKSRLKDENHLADKIKRKWDNGDFVDGSNLFENITDLAGVRILHLHQTQFPKIHEEIMNKVDTNEWFLDENPKAYTWDPESKAYYEGLGINCEMKHSYYTSIHYILKPKENSNFKCEVQVRTLFEEIWGEIDHTINYPSTTESIACTEQLKVLARLASTGTKLADAIFRSYEEFKINNP